VKTLSILILNLYILSVINHRCCRHVLEILLFIFIAPLRETLQLHVFGKVPICHWISRCAKRHRNIVCRLILVAKS